MRVCDLLVVVVVVPHLSATGLVAPNSVSVLAEPVEIGVRPNVQRHVVSLLWQCGRQLSANPLETVRDCSVLHIFACVSHARSGIFRANTRAASRLSEGVGSHVIAIVIAIVLALHGDETTVGIVLVIVVNLCGIIRSMIGTIAHGVWHWCRVNIDTLNVPIRSKSLQFLRNVAEHILWKLRMIFQQSGQKQIVEVGLAKILLALALCACLPSNKSDDAACWHFLGSVVLADEVAECLARLNVKLKLRVWCPREHHWLNLNGAALVAEITQNRRSQCNN